MQSLEEGILTRFLHLHVRCSISHSSQDTEATRVHGQTVGKKAWNIHMWNYSGVRRKEAMICGTMDGLEGMRLRGLSQAEKDRQGMTLLVCRI